MDNDCLSRHTNDRYSFAGILDTTDIGSRRGKEWPIKYVHRFLFDMESGSRVLEIGPRRGDFAVECRRQNWEYVGTEPSESVIQILKSKGLFVVNARVPPIPASNESFDLIHVAQVIEHFNNIREFTFFVRNAGGLYALVACYPLPVQTI